MTLQTTISAIFLACLIWARLSSPANAELLCEALFARIDADATLKVCDRDIKSGGLKGEDLAYAYYSRGDVHLMKAMPATYANWLDTTVGNDGELGKALSDLYYSSDNVSRIPFTSRVEKYFIMSVLRGSCCLSVVRE